MSSFSSRIRIININPYVTPPLAVLRTIWKQAGKETGPIQVKGKLNGFPFLQNLLRYEGAWRLYLNTPMRKSSGLGVGDVAHVEIEYDPKPRIVPMIPSFKKALSKSHKAAQAFDKLTPSRRKEILRYLANLKTDESRKRNIDIVIRYLSGQKGKHLAIFG